VQWSGENASVWDERACENPLMTFTIVMGPGQKILCLGSGRVSHLWFGFKFGKFPLKMSNFSIFSLRVKINIFGSGRKVPGSASYLLRIKSKLGSGQGPSLLHYQEKNHTELFIDRVAALYKRRESSLAMVVGTSSPCTEMLP